MEFEPPTGMHCRAKPELTNMFLQQNHNNQGSQNRLCNVLQTDIELLWAAFRVLQLQLQERMTYKS